MSAQKNLGHRITIGFAGIADFRSFIGQEYIAGIMKAANDYDINFINFAGAIKYSLLDDMNFITHYLKTFTFMKKPLIDGLVTWASSLQGFLDSEKVKEKFTSLAPLPMVDIGHMDIPGIPSIRIDNNSSISLVLEHLVKVHDYERFVFIGSESSRPHMSRLEAYRNELKRIGIKELPDSIYTVKAMESPQIAEVVETLMSHYDLRNRAQIDCIITPSDIVASMLIDELEKRGINVPRDIAITGFNNQYDGIEAHIPVTTVNLEYFKRGYSAVEFLIDRIMSPDEECTSKYVNTALLIRQSCGCFEKSIIDAGLHIPAQDDFSINTTSSEDELRQYLSSKVRDIFMPHSDEPDIQELVDAILFDIYDQNMPGELLRWFQKQLKNFRAQSALENDRLQQSITSLRRIILPMVKDDENQYHHMEDIFNQLRALIAVYIGYDTVSSRTNSYLTNNLSQIAIKFATATTGKQVQEALKYQLNEMKIPGVIMVLSENISSDLDDANIEFVLPEPQEHIREILPYRVKTPALMPKMFFPQGKRFSVMLEILYHQDMYFGYAFFEMGNQNISVYDTVRLLLSNALSSIYISEGRTREKSTFLKSEQISGILNQPEKAPETHYRGLRAKQITDYLIEHLGEMTNLDQMSEDLSVSKSHLVRRAKELTGFTIQNLHERLKIEQAKNLLQMDTLKLSEIADRLGFQSQNYFSSVFKKNTGMSPRDWAKSNK